MADHDVLCDTDVCVGGFEEPVSPLSPIMASLASSSAGDPKTSILQCEREIRRLTRIPRGRVIGLAAPTGSGKTTGLWKTIANNAPFFGRTLFVFPTQMAARAIVKVDGEWPHLLAASPRRAIRELVVNRKSRFDTIVIDEAHYACKEYVALLDILAVLRQESYHRRFRVILLSATLDEETIRQRFSDMEFRELVEARSPHPIDIRYRAAPLPGGNVPNQRALFEATIETLRSIVTEASSSTTTEKILIFYASHQQCETVRHQLERLQTVAPPVTVPPPKTDEEQALRESLRRYRILTLHGGKTDEEFNEARRLIEQIDLPTICICTNIAETAVTLPGTTRIIDSGLRCMVVGNSVVQVRCDKVSMIQRAGRTGRTCPGVVYRLMSRSQYDHLPFADLPDFSYDSVVLQLLIARADPVYFLREKGAECIQKFVRLGIMRTPSVLPDDRLMEFLDQCGLEIENGLLLHALTHSSECDPKIRALIVLSIVLINVYDIKHFHLIYVSPENRLEDTVNVNIRLQDEFGRDHDMLLTVIRILLHVFLDADPRRVAADFSLNFRILREIRKELFRVWRFLYNKPMDFAGVFEGLQGGLPPRSVDGIRKFLLYASGRYTVVPCLYTLRDPERFHPSPDYRSVCHLPTRRRLVHASRFMRSQIFHHTFVPLGRVHDISRIHAGDDDGMGIGSVRLWTLPPQDYRHRLRVLYDDVVQARHHMDEKWEWRRVYDACVREVEEDVAFWPGMAKMQEAHAHFLSLVNPEK